jgi:hypothetical protein
MFVGLFTPGARAGGSRVSRRCGVGMTGCISHNAADDENDDRSKTDYSREFIYIYIYRYGRFGCGLFFLE